MAEVAQRSEQRLGARIAEAQGRDALAGRRHGWQLQTFKEGRRRDRSVRDALSLQEPGIDLAPNRARKWGNVSRPLVRWKSSGSLIVVSVRSARCSLKYCLTWECLNSTCRLGATP